MKIAKLLLCAVFSAACGLATDRSAAALPVAVAYPGENYALKQLNPDERTVLDAIEKDRTAHGQAQFRWDGMTSAVAREHSEDMAANNYTDYVSPRLGTLEYRLHRAGISGANARFMVFHAPSAAAVVESLKQSAVLRDGAGDLGIGVAAKGAQDLYVTLIFLERRSALEVFPTLPLLGAEYKLAGRLDAGLKSPGLAITTPDGRVTERPLDLAANGRFSTTYRFDQGRGEYSVEVTAVGKLGPTVVDLMHCYAGVEYPAPAVPPKPEAAPADLRVAERAMADRINQARAEANLPALAYDARLADVARGHSEDMLKNKYFAHISPTAGDLLARMKRGGVTARKFTENIANNQDLATAHRDLMDSPGHRKNIVDPEVIRVGVGIVRDEGGQFLVTEDFLQEFPNYDPAALAAELIRGLNDARAREAAKPGASERPAPLASSPALTAAALEIARAMSLNGKLASDKAQALLRQKKLPGKSVEMGLFCSTDPTKAAQIAEALKARYQDIGVGIVQTAAPSGEKLLWTAVLLGQR